MLRNYGTKVKYQHELPGVNSRFDEMQAAFLRFKLAHLEEWNDRPKSIAALYHSQLSSLNPRLVLPFVPEWADPVWHLFVVRHNERDKLQHYLTVHGIQTLIHYPIQAHRSGAFSNLGHREGSLKMCERLSREVLSLPIGPQLLDTDALEVTKTLDDFLN